MQILIKHTSSYTHAFMVCDICGRQIDQAEHAEYVFRDFQFPEGEIVGIVIGHKFCIQSREKADPDWAAKFCNNMNVEHLLAYLLVTSGANFERVKSDYETIKRIYSSEGEGNEES